MCPYAVRGVQHNSNRVPGFLGAIVVMLKVLLLSLGLFTYISGSGVSGDQYL